MLNFKRLSILPEGHFEQDEKVFKRKRSEEKKFGAMILVDGVSNMAGSKEDDRFSKRRRTEEEIQIQEDAKLATIIGAFPQRITRKQSRQTGTPMKTHPNVAELFAASSPRSSRSASPAVGESPKKKRCFFPSEVDGSSKLSNKEKARRTPKEVLAEFTAAPDQQWSPKKLGYYLNLAVFCKDEGVLDDILKKCKGPHKDDILNWVGFDPQYRVLSESIRLVEDCEAVEVYNNSDYRIPYCHGITAISWAILLGHDELTLKLIKAGSNVGVVGINLMGPIDIAMSKGNEVVFNHIYTNAMFNKAEWIDNFKHIIPGVHLAIQHLGPDPKTCPYHKMLDAVRKDCGDGSLNQPFIGERRPLQFAIGALNKHAFLYLCELEGCEIRFEKVFKQLAYDYHVSRPLDQFRDFVSAITTKAIELNKCNAEEVHPLLSTDSKGNTAMHYAASNQIMIEVLSSHCADIVQRSVSMLNHEGQVPRDFSEVIFFEIEGFLADKIHLLGRFPPNVLIAFVKHCLGIGMSPNKTSEGDKIYTGSAMLKEQRVLLRNDIPVPPEGLAYRALHPGYSHFRESLTPLWAQFSGLKGSDSPRAFKKMKADPKRYEPLLKKVGLSLKDLELPLSVDQSQRIAKLIEKKLSVLNVSGLASVLTGTKTFLDHPERAYLVARMIAAFFCIDDRGEDEETVESARLNMNRLLDIMNGDKKETELGDDEYPDFIEMARIRTDLLEMMKTAIQAAGADGVEKMLSTWIERMREQLESVVWEVEKQHAQKSHPQDITVDTLPSYQETQRQARITAGYYPIMTLIDILLEVPEISKEPPIKEFDELVSDAIRKINDVDSLRKELIDTVGKDIFDALDLSTKYDSFLPDVKEKFPVIPPVVLAAKEHQSLLYAWMKTAFDFNQLIEQILKKYDALVQDEKYSDKERERVFISLLFALRTHDWQTVFSGRYNEAGEISEGEIMLWKSKNGV
ncbi:hypothetical protein DID77_04005 [Candidatus Marinamargulisbacteria bacterium SCGC AG-439-L15]|nr:hypothetical protein DID77_04005 [Candidatus Marinamargulisbacteria bacterium SCGC AG-439-L15]